MSFIHSHERKQRKGKIGEFGCFIVRLSNLLKGSKRYRIRIATYRDSISSFLLPVIWAPARAGHGYANSWEQPAAKCIDPQCFFRSGLRYF
jgi:hypothetical protein